MTTTKKPNGLMLAATAAALFATGAVYAGGTGAAATEAQVQCAGINACKGHSECKTASSACKGQNGCKGQGWEYRDSAEQCEADGGKVVEM